MDINVFREFAEVALQGSYSAAAKALNLSQPTLSRHVMALEKELNAKLVADVLPVRLTPAGNAVLQTALSLGDLYAGMQDDLAALRRSAPALIRIHDTPATRPLSARIVAATNEVLRVHPETTVEYVEARSGRTPAETVAEGSCDLAFEQVVEESGEEDAMLGAEAACLGAEAGTAGARADGVGGARGARSAQAGGTGARVRTAPVPRASERLLFGLPREAAGSLRSASLVSLRHETFFLPARRSCEPLKASFAEACRRRGFRPSLKMLACDRYEEFYLVDHGDGVHVLAEGDLLADPSFARRLEERLALVPLDDADALRLRWYAVHRSPGADADFARFLRALTAADAS